MFGTKYLKKMTNLIKIDGSLGEGGGQVLRVSLSLSALLGIPVEIDNIRAGRPKPGLAAQHLKGVELIKELCNAQVTGACIGSTKLEFHPKQIQGQKLKYEADTGTAGCICLLAQVALPCALFAPTSSPIHLLLKGGTNVPMGPQIEYLTEVFKPFLNKFGADFDFTVIRRGYYPQGGGEFHLHIMPVNSLKPINITEPGDPVKITGWSFVAGAVSINEAHRMANDAKMTLTETFKRHDIVVPSIDILPYKENRDMAVGHGSGINLVCHTNTNCVLGGSGLGSKREKNCPGIDAANEILTSILSKSCVDQYTQDQMIIFMALAKGYSKVFLGENQLTSHTQTAIKVAEIMLADKNLRFTLTGNSNNGNGGPYILECEGCGLINNLYK